MTGEFSGEVKWVHGGVRRFSGIADITFKDTFTDPLDMIEARIKYNEAAEYINEWLARHFGVSKELIPLIAITAQMIRDAEVGGTPYDIGAEWREEFAGEARLKESD